jgi:hypothetical protein
MTIMQWLNELDKLHDAYLKTGSQYLIILWEEILMAGPPSIAEGR